MPPIKRDVTVIIRCTTEDVATIDKAADQLRTTRSEFIRSAALAKAKRAASIRARKETK